MVFVRYFIASLYLLLWAVGAAASSADQSITIDPGNFTSRYDEGGYIFRRSQSNIGASPLGEALEITTVTGWGFDFQSFTYDAAEISDRVIVNIEGSRNGNPIAKQRVELSNSPIKGFRKKKVKLNSGFNDVDRVRVEYSAAGYIGIIRHFTFQPIPAIQPDNKQGTDAGIATAPQGLSFAHATEPEIFASVLPVLEKLMTAEAMRRLDSAIEADQSMLRDARDRFINDRQKRKSCVRISGKQYCRDILPRDALGFDMKGMARIKNQLFRSHGTFATAKSVGMDQAQRVTLGGFNIRTDKKGRITAGVSTRLVWEFRPRTDQLIGLHIGAGLGSATIRGNMRGQSGGMNISAGPYFVSTLSPDLFLSGFATMGYGWADMTARNHIFAIQGNSAEYWTLSKLAMTGVHRFSTFELRPELSLNFGKSRRGPTDMTVRTFIQTGQATVVGRNVTIFEVTFQPEILIPLVRPHMPGAKGMLNLAPGLNCRRVKRSEMQRNCSKSLRLGLRDSRRNGLLRMDTGVELRRAKGRETVGVKLNIEHRF